MRRATDKKYKGRVYHGGYNASIAGLRVTFPQTGRRKGDIIKIKGKDMVVMMQDFTP